MTVRVVYRLYGGENKKGRPDYYSKETCLASLLRSADAASVEVTILADGPLPPHLERLAAHATTIPIPNGPVGMRGSFRAAISTPERMQWPDEDVVYFSEDDYLHRTDALVRLREAAEHLPEAAYFALYASTPAYPAVAPGERYRAPRDWIERPPATVGETRWVNVPSTASTFGARVGALRTDLGIIRQAMVPYPTRFLDHEMCLVYQGRFPYSGGDVFLGLEENRFRSGVKALSANAVLTPFRAAYNARALTRRAHPHLLYAAEPNLATHMESALLSFGTDWSQVAAEAREWAASLPDAVD